MRPSDVQRHGFQQQRGRQLQRRPRQDRPALEPPDWQEIISDTRNELDVVVKRTQEGKNLGHYQESYGECCLRTSRTSYFNTISN